jgi:hypothetical protein
MARLAPAPGSVDTDLFIDWAKPRRADATTKGMGLIGVKMERPEKTSMDGLVSRHPPPRRLFIEGIPRIRWDELIDLGYDVYYCGTRSLPTIRRARIGGRARGETGLADPPDEYGKGDIRDPKALKDFAGQIRWYRAERTEPYVTEAIRRLGNRRLLLTLGKQAAQHATSESYKDISFFREKQDEIEAELKELQKDVERYCREIGLHEFHEKIYNVKCLTMLTAMSKRPWAFDRRAWRKINGCTDSAYYPDVPTMHSLASDSTLKALIHGSMATLIGKKSPYRALYEAKKATLGPTVKHGKSGRGNFKVSPHDKALNRVTTKVIDSLRIACRQWHEANGQRGSISLKRR